MKKLLLKTMLLLCALIAGSSRVWAETYTIGWGQATGDNSTNFTTTSGTIPNLFSFSTAKNSGSSAPAYGKKDKILTLYRDTSNGNGGSITITPASGITITGFVMATESDPSVKYAVDGGTPTNVLESSFTYTANGFSATSSLQIQDVDKDDHLKIKTIAITYTITASNITAVSNNESWGTVEVYGNVITATPNSGYRVSKTTPYTITSGEIDDSSISQDGNSFIVTATGKCTIRINFEAIPTHTAKFSINGDIDNSNNVVVGEDEIITFPAPPTTLGGKAFVGWTTSAISGTTDTAPATLIKATTTLMGENDITYYAVYAIGSAGETTTLTDVLDYTVTGITSSDYYDFSDKQAENGSSAVYAGNCAGSEIYIRLRNEQNSGIISTTSGGKLKKVTVDWAGTQVRTLNIYGKNTAYTAASQLYDASASKRGTLLGTIVKDTSTELTIDGDYEYIGIRSNDGALFCNSISIEWETEEAEYSAYCTTVTLTTPAVTSDGWATYVTPYALRFGEGDAYIVNTTGDKVVYLESVTDVPASTPVILKGEGTKTATVLTTADAITDNKLAISDGNVTSCYVLAKKINGVGFYKWTGGALSAGRVYLPTSVVTSAHEFLGLTLGDETGVNEVRGRRSEGRGEVYDLQGRKVLKPTQGLYIVNGKRVAVK